MVHTAFLKIFFICHLAKYSCQILHLKFFCLKGVTFGDFPQVESLLIPLPCYIHLSPVLYKYDNENSEMLADVLYFSK